MDFRQLRYFVAICNHKNLSHAADQCNVAQSALSHHLAKLEDEIGVPLFARKPRGMEPTAAGWRLYEHADGILKSIEEAVNDVRQDAAALTGNVAIGMPYSVLKVIGVPLMRRILSDYPNIKVLLNESLSGVGYRNLVQGDCDFALLYNPPVEELTIRTALIEEELYCIGLPSVIGDTEAPIAFNDLTTLPLVMLSSGVLSRALLDRPQLLNRLQDHASVQLASIAGTIGALEAGLGCTLAPRVLAQEQLDSGLLIARPVVDPNPTRTLFLTQMAHQKPSFLSEAMIRLTKELVEESVTSGHWASARLLIDHSKPGKHP